MDHGPTGVLQVCKCGPLAMGVRRRARGALAPPPGRPK